MGSRISFLLIRAKITYFGFLTPYCRVDLKRSPPTCTDYFHRYSFPQNLRCIYEIKYGILLTHFKLSIRFPAFRARIGKGGNVKGVQESVFFL